MMDPTIKVLVQICAAATGIPAVALTFYGREPGKEKWGKVGAVLGVIAQPFWIYGTWAEGQYGMCLEICTSASVWCWGCWRVWRKKGVGGGCS